MFSISDNQLYQIQTVFLCRSFAILAQRSRVCLLSRMYGDKGEYGINVYVLKINVPESICSISRCSQVTNPKQLDNKVVYFHVLKPVHHVSVV